MNTDQKVFFVGDRVEIVSSDGLCFNWTGFRATVLPWPKDEEQWEDGMLQNWLMPESNRPDNYGMKEFMWPANNLRKVDF